MSSSEDSSLSPSVSKRAKFNSGNENGDGDNEADIAIPSEDVANHANESDNLPQKETSVSSDPALNDSTKKVKIPIVGNTLFTDYGDEQISKIQQEWETTENISGAGFDTFLCLHELFLTLYFELVKSCILLNTDYTKYIYNLQF